jgi:pimeloyl-ACP methyl ester carboxylesterase
MKLFFRRFGHGNPIVILHGLFGISDNWVTIGKRLAKNFDVYIPDLRNHGQSPHSGVFNFPALVEDLVEFTEENNLKEIILIGHSLGGIIAMQFALQNSSLVKKIIVVDISLRKYQNYDDHQQLINAMLSVDFSYARKRSDVEKQLMNTIKSVKLRQFLLKNVYWRNKDTLDWRLNLAGLHENLPLIYESTTDEKQFTGPALFIRGGLSDYILDEDLDEICKKFPRAELSTVPNATHWVHADAPEEFLEIVSRFLLSHEG